MIGGPRYVAGVALATRIVFGLFLIVGVLITGSALLDNLFGLGWGYEWKDAVLGAVVMAGGFFVYWVCSLMFRVMGVR